MDQATLPGDAPRFVVCLRNDGAELDLAPRKVYAVLPDASAERSGWIRVIDETGEDYLYPADYFGSLDPLPVTGSRRPRPACGG